MDIKWQEGAVCFAYGKQVFACDNGLLDSQGLVISCSVTLKANDFQINTIKKGYYTPKSELNTEDKYNRAVEVFGLFGYEFDPSKSSHPCDFKAIVKNGCGEHLYVSELGFLRLGNLFDCSRKLTYPQLMAIGELKRLELERSAPKIAPDLTPDLGIVSSNKYERDITDRKGNSAVVDVYDVLKAFDVTCPATQHALKKLLCSGLRGHKDLQTDLLEAKESITRAIELNG